MLDNFYLRSLYSFFLNSLSEKFTLTSTRLRRMAMLWLGQALPETVRDFDLSAMKERLRNLEGAINIEWDRLLSGKEGNSKVALIMHCQVLIKQHHKPAAVVLHQYQAVLKKLEEDQEFMEGAMTSAQKERVRVELKQFKDICRLNFKDGVTEALSAQHLGLVENFEQECPLMIDDILKTLLISESARRSMIKTLQHRKKCGINALTCLLSVRNQRCENDINLAFGMICVTYGGGKQFINMLHAIGLTPSWDKL